MGDFRYDNDIAEFAEREEVRDWRFAERGGYSEDSFGANINNNDNDDDDFLDGLTRRRASMAKVANIDVRLPIEKDKSNRKEQRERQRRQARMAEEQAHQTMNRIRKSSRSSRRAQPRGRGRGRGGGGGGGGDDDDGDGEVEEMAEMDKDAKMATMFKFVGKDLLGYKKLTGQHMERDPEQERKIKNLLANLPSLIQGNQENRVDILSLFDDDNDDDDDGDDGDTADVDDLGNNRIRRTHSCRICKSTGIDPIGFGNMNALHAMNFVEAEMIGCVDKETLVQNKARVFNLFQIGLALKGGKCNHLVTKTDVMIHTQCSNNLLDIQNDIVTLLRQIMNSLSSQVTGEIITEDGERVQYTSNARIRTILTVASALEKATVRFHTTKRLVNQAIDRGEAAVDAMSVIGNAKSMSDAKSIKTNRINAMKASRAGTDAGGNRNGANNTNESANGGGGGGGNGNGNHNDQNGGGGDGGGASATRLAFSAAATKGGSNKIS